MDEDGVDDALVVMLRRDTRGGRVEGRALLLLRQRGILASPVIALTSFVIPLLRRRQQLVARNAVILRYDVGLTVSIGQLLLRGVTTLMAA